MSQDAVVLINLFISNGKKEDVVQETARVMKQSLLRYLSIGKRSFAGAVASSAH